jgi:hypothetical protein
MERGGRRTLHYAALLQLNLARALYLEDWTPYYTYEAAQDAQHVGANQMQDLFSHEAQTADRDRSLTTAIIDSALERGFSIRLQDAHGDNNTTETRSRQTILDAVGSSRSTTFHIIDMRKALGKNVGQVTVYHGDEADKITESIGRNGEQNEAFIATLAVKPILQEIAEYCDSIKQTTTANRKTHTDTKTGLTLETVSTGELNEGDFIRANGCLMQLGTISSKPNDQGHPERGDTRWARGYILPQPDTGAIPRSWLDRDETGAAYWIIQGNDLASWQRFTDPAAVPTDYDAAAKS